MSWLTIWNKKIYLERYSDSKFNPFDNEYINMQNVVSMKVVSKCDAFEWSDGYDDYYDDTIRHAFNVDGTENAQVYRVRLQLTNGEEKSIDVLDSELEKCMKL